MSMSTITNKRRTKKCFTSANITHVVMFVLVLCRKHWICCCSGFLVQPSSNPILPSLSSQHQRQRQQQIKKQAIVTALSAKSGTKKKKNKSNIICVNRLAYRNYEIVDSLETGISLKGTEVKSIRDGKMNIRDGYVRPTRNGRSCILHNVHIGKHSMAGEYFQHEERRPRDLLVHAYQARKLLQQSEQQGMTIIPLKAYFNDQNKIKLEIALCRGKNVRDKREAIKERDVKRETSRIMKNFRG